MQREQEGRGTRRGGVQEKILQDKRERKIKMEEIKQDGERRNTTTCCINTFPADS